jgi:hypothetical protein
MSGVNVTICDGKYTVIQEPTGGTRVLRYGEEWRDVTGDNVIGGLAWELQEAREKIVKLEGELGDAYTELRKQRPISVFDPVVWRRAKEAKL